MRSVADPAELALVMHAIALGKSARGYCEWQESAVRRLLHRPPFPGFTPEGIRERLCRFVVDENGTVAQVKEKRLERMDRRYYYKAIVPVPELARGLFVELVLIDDDAKAPAVQIVNAHEQGR
jgi:hypothetical protein